MKSLFRLALAIAVLVAITKITGGTRWLNARDHTATGDNPWWLAAIAGAALLWFHFKGKRGRAFWPGIFYADNKRRGGRRTTVKRRR